MAERAEELRQQLDEQRAGISRTVEEIENRVVPGRVLNRRRYRMRRSMVDFKDRLMGNDEPDYPAHWYSQPAAPMGPGYAQTTGQGTQHSFAGGGGDDSGRVGEMRDRAQGTVQDVSGRAQGAAHEISGRAQGAAHEVSGRAQGAAHEVSDRAQGAMHQVSDRAHGVAENASGAMHQVGDHLSDAPQMVRRQAQGNPLAVGLVTFGAGLIAASLLPETQKERQLARKAEPKMQQALEGGKSYAGEVAQGVATDLRDSAKDHAEEVARTAAHEALDLASDAKKEAKAAGSDAQASTR